MGIFISWYTSGGGYGDVRDGFDIGFCDFIFDVICCFLFFSRNMESDSESNRVKSRISISMEGKK